MMRQAAGSAGGTLPVPRVGRAAGLHSFIQDGRLSGTPRQSVDTHNHCRPPAECSLRGSGHPPWLPSRGWRAPPGRTSRARQRITEQTRLWMPIESKGQARCRYEGSGCPPPRLPMRSVRQTRGRQAEPPYCTMRCPPFSYFPFASSYVPPTHPLLADRAGVPPICCSILHRPARQRSHPQRRHSTRQP